MFDSEFRIWISTARERYSFVKSLLKRSVNDPESEPYKSKYEAKDILLKLVSDIEKWKSRDNLLIIHCLFRYKLGVISLETEELSAGCEYLTSSWEDIQNFARKPECCVLALSILNQLGILWCERGENEKGCTYLEEAENIYYQYKETNETIPYSLDDLFSIETGTARNWSTFEDIFTHTLYYLAQVYEHLKKNDKAAKYCHMTLKRQKESGKYKANSWAINCATLSQYYVQEKKYIEARHLLSCSSSILSAYEKEVEQDAENEDTLEELRRSKAEVAWCWLKYCLNLLLDPPSASETDSKNDIITDFVLFRAEDVICMEKEVSACINSFEDARHVFLFAQNQILTVKSYYTLNHHANNHVQLVRDHSKLYKSLSTYESDLGRKCKMHKRSVDLLEGVLSKLNPQYYLAVCRQLMFELGETYYEMVDLKLKLSQSSTEGLSIRVVKKINCLIMHSIKHFENFSNFVKNRDGTFPEALSDDLVRPVLVAHFYLGGLYSKLIECDTNKKLHNLSKSEEYYKFILNYIEKNPSDASSIEKELPVVKEMVELMPQKIMYITGSTIF
ncbi:KIF1-binding protein-like protein, partial [Stegodyphus mimosarum]